MKWRAPFAIATWVPGRSPSANSPDSTSDDNSGPYPLGRFGTCPHSQLWGVSGHVCYKTCGVFRDTPTQNALQSTSPYRRGNCSRAQQCVGEQQAGWGASHLTLTTAPPDLLIFRRGFSLGNLGSLLRSEHWGIQGHCQHPKWAKHLTFNTAIIGAVVAFHWRGDKLNSPLPSVNCRGIGYASAPAFF